MKICPQCLRQFGDDVEECPDDRERLRKFHDLESQMVGTTVDGRWEIGEKIGEGGMGEIFRGQQVSVDRAVAIKMLRPALASNEQYVSRFFREANIATNISHPNLIHIYDFGQSEESQVLYLAMEYLEGISLLDRMRQGRLPLEDILQIGCQICAGLSAAHAEEIVHRDLKPENVFLVDTAEEDEIFVKLLDFGIAKDLGSDVPMTRTGQLFGTPEYMSPEQCQEGGSVDQRSDLYSLGCILYELIAGHSPFHRSSVIKTLLAQVSDEPTPVGELDIPLPSGVAEIVSGLLEKDPRERLASAVDVRRLLEAELEKLRDHPEAAAAFADAERPVRSRTVRSSEETAVYTSGKRGVGEPPGAKTSRYDESVGASLSSSVEEDGEDEEPVHRGSGPPARKLRPSVIVTIALVVSVGGGVLAYTLAGAPTESDPPADAEQKKKPRPPKASFAPALAAAAPAYDAARGASQRAGLAWLAGDEVGEAARAAGEESRTAADTSADRPPKNDEDEETDEALLDVRTPASIERRARTYERQLLECYGLRSDLDASGAVTFRFRILKDGAVDHARVVKTAFDDAVGQCIVEKVSTWSFKPSTVGSGIDHHERRVNFEFTKRDE